MSLKCIDTGELLDTICRKFEEAPTKNNGDFERFYGAVRAVSFAIEQGTNIKCKNCHYWVHPKNDEIYGKCGWTQWKNSEDDFCSNFEQEV